MGLTCHLQCYLKYKSASHVFRLQNTMQQLPPPKVEQQTARKTYISEDL